MPRPSKSAHVHQDRTQTKDEMNKRILAETKLKGNADEIKPSSRLNANQKKIFEYIVSNLKESKILGNLDLAFLEIGVIAIDRLQNIEKMINQDFELINNRDLMNAKKQYTADFFKFCQEACLSPQARAKMGIIAANKALEDADPLLKVLKNKSS